ncbi:hypothetical protein BKA70DRAFT_1238697 [Coprinopsis sp. MPI-PUGE-AT-0042]|nr:hypothetical protein BKA70DRAFT_1238697 [Coprinopsis sp. MPI-PUGE-AT-0042]
MPVVTRAQSPSSGPISARRHATGNPAEKHVRRSHATSARGRVQSLLTRTTWETRRELQDRCCVLSGETFARTVDPFVNMRKLLEDELKVERDLVATSQMEAYDSPAATRSHRIDQRRYIALKSLLAPEGDLSLYWYRLTKRLVIEGPIQCLVLRRNSLLENEISRIASKQPFSLFRLDHGQQSSIRIWN